MCTELSYICPDFVETKTLDDAMLALCYIAKEFV